MFKDKIALALVVAGIAAFLVWTAAGSPPYGPWGSNMGFDDSWDCPPNVKPSATVCIKRPRAIPGAP
jgi:hypothetical protein